MYFPLALYDLDGNFLAFTIGKAGPDGTFLKLHTTNVWAQEDGVDLSQQIERLNDQNNILPFWPQVRDPEVQALLDDPEFEPVQLSSLEIPDETKCVYVYLEPPREEDGFPGAIDENNSIIVMKTIMAPSSAATLKRAKAACEVIARQRMENVGGTEAVTQL